MPADASPAATDRPEPSGSAAVARRDAGVTIPPPRSAPAEADRPTPDAGGPGRPAPSTDGPEHPAPGVGGPGRAAPGADASTAPGDAGVERQPAPAAAGTDGGASSAGGAGELTERERRILAFEQQWWKHAGAKEQAIRDTFGLSATRYYQLLNGLLDHPAALAAEPVLVGRLRRLRSSRARNRRR